VEHYRLSNGSLMCRYWEVDPTDCKTCQSHKPYRVEVIGVTCDPGLAVARGVWRKLRTGRSVRSATLLRSHRLFSEHFERTAHLVDVATLYHTGTDLLCIVLCAATRCSMLKSHTCMCVSWVYARCYCPQQRLVTRYPLWFSVINGSFRCASEKLTGTECTVCMHTVLLLTSV